ncbi:hypothetical protein ACWGTI_03375 [Mesorhizobium sp. ArgA1]
MPRRQKVGTGITRHERVHFDVTETEAFAAIVDPAEDFPRWMCHLQDELALALQSSDLPEAGRLVEFDKLNPAAWKYADAVDIKSAGKRTYARTCWYLQSFKYQSKLWYIGKLLELIDECNHALEKSELLRMAGYAVKLGSFWRESSLKFSGQKRLEDFERQATGADEGNRVRKEKASAWQAQARKIIQANADIDLSNCTEAAKTILNTEWPTTGLAKPSLRTLRGYLAKRAVLPEIKKSG